MLWSQNLRNTDFCVNVTATNRKSFFVNCSEYNKYWDTEFIKNQSGAYKLQWKIKIKRFPDYDGVFQFESR